MSSTLIIRGEKYLVSDEQKSAIEKLDQEMREAIMAEPEPSYNESVVGNAADPFKHIVDEYVQKIIDVALSY